MLFIYNKLLNAILTVKAVFPFSTCTSSLADLILLFKPSLLCVLLAFIHYELLEADMQTFT